MFHEKQIGGLLELSFGNGAIDFGRIRRGDLVWRTHDPELDKIVRTNPIRKQPLTVHVTAREGAPLRTVWTASKTSVTVESPEPLGTARNRSLDVEFLREQLGRLGTSSSELAGMELAVEG